MSRKNTLIVRKLDLENVYLKIMKTYIFAIVIVKIHINLERQEPICGSNSDPESCSLKISEDKKEETHFTTSAVQLALRACSQERAAPRKNTFH